MAAGLPSDLEKETLLASLVGGKWFIVSKSIWAQMSLWAEKSWVKTLLQHSAAGKVTYHFMRYLASLDFSLFVCFLIYKMRLTMPFLEGFWEEEVR